MCSCSVVYGEWNQIIIYKGIPHSINQTQKIQFSKKN